VTKQVAGGGVDQRDGAGAVGDPARLPLGPRDDRDTAHGMAGNHGALPSPARTLNGRDGGSTSAAVNRRAPRLTR